MIALVPGSTVRRSVVQANRTHPLLRPGSTRRCTGRPVPPSRRAGRNGAPGPRIEAGVSGAPHPWRWIRSACSWSARRGAQSAPGATGAATAGLGVVEPAGHPAGVSAAITGSLLLERLGHVTALVDTEPQAGQRRRGEKNPGLSLQSSVLSPWSKPGRGASGISPPNTGADVANDWRRRRQASIGVTRAMCGRSGHEGLADAKNAQHAREHPMLLMSALTTSPSGRKVAASRAT